MFSNRGILTDVINNVFDPSTRLVVKNSAFWSRVTLIGIQGWLGSAYVFLLSTGVLQAIPADLYEAAQIDGANFWRELTRVVLPIVTPGIAAVALICFIFAWNEYAFALMLTSQNARTAPPAIATMQGRGGIEWSAIAAGTLAFLIPVVIVAFALRRHLLRGVTFGAIRQ